MGKMIDLTGKKFGKLTVISCAGKLDGRRYSWNCKCDCGNEVVKSGACLTSGNTKSCGCGKYDGLTKYNQEQSDLNKIEIGTRFGKLVVVEDLGFRPQYNGATKNRRWYKCQCDCGNICEASGNQLKTKNKISCGYCQISKGELLVKTLLDNNNIIYNQEVVFSQLTDESGRRLRFDFVIYDENNKVNRVIEYDGRQHFFGPDTNYWGHSTDTLEAIKERDILKNNFCLKNNYPLIRIPYTVTNLTIEDIFSDKFLVKKEGD